MNGGRSPGRPLFRGGGENPADLTSRPRERHFWFAEKRGENSSIPPSDFLTWIIFFTRWVAVFPTRIRPARLTSEIASITRLRVFHSFSVKMPLPYPACAKQAPSEIPAVVGNQPSAKRMPPCDRAPGFAVPRHWFWRNEAMGERRGTRGFSGKGTHARV